MPALSLPDWSELCTFNLITFGAANLIKKRCKIMIFSGEELGISGAAPCVWFPGVEGGDGEGLQGKKSPKFSHKSNKNESWDSGGGQGKGGFISPSLNPPRPRPRGPSGNGIIPPKPRLLGHCAQEFVLAGWRNLKFTPKTPLIYPFRIVHICIYLCIIPVLLNVTKKNPINLH